MAGDSIVNAGDQYSKVVGFVYVFNLIVGTGALTMPQAFRDAGWSLSLVILIVLAFMSYITLTFVTEVMAISNAKMQFHRFVLEESQENFSDHSVNLDEDERRHLLDHPHKNNGPSFDIQERVELGAMASMFFNKIGLGLFNLCIIVYLYGDLSIYSAAVPKSIRDVACTFMKNDSVPNATKLGDDDPCWEGVEDINRMDAYRIFVAVFVCLIGPFVFFNVSKTKHLQIMTSLARWISFILMIILASVWLARGKGTGHPRVADITGVPNLFGVCVYSFMCHHSLPSLITPIRNKSKLYPMLATNYTLILVFYLILSFTAVFAVADLKDLYTLNFRPNDEASITNIVPFQYFLALFPVFTLSTNFPIIAITLKNNLIALITSIMARDPPTIVSKIVCPLLALLPPVAISLITNKVEFLVGITGSYAGAAIQYAIPALLVFYARKDILAIGREYKHQSPFRSKFWIFAILVWTVLCIGFVTVNHILNGS